MHVLDVRLLAQSEKATESDSLEGERLRVHCASALRGHTATVTRRKNKVRVIAKDPVVFASILTWLLLNIQLGPNSTMSMYQSFDHELLAPGVEGES